MDTKEGVDAVRKKVQRTWYYYTETKTNLTDNGTNNLRRTIVEVEDEFKLKFVWLKELFDRVGATLTVSELCRELPVHDNLDWSYFFMHPGIV